MTSLREQIADAIDGHMHNAAEQPFTTAYLILDKVMEVVDAEICAHARTDVPALVARVRELETERDGTLALLREAQRIVDQWTTSQLNSSNAVHAITELRHLLNPHHTPETP